MCRTDLNGEDISLSHAVDTVTGTLGMLVGTIAATTVAISDAIRVAGKWL